MTPTYSCYREFFAQCEPDTTILTPNHRLARFIQDQYLGYMAVEADSAWPSLRCAALGSWVQNTYLESGLDLKVLTDSQCKALWRSLIKDYDPDGLYADAVVDELANAARRSREWLLDGLAIAGESEELVLFKALYRSYLHSLEQLGAMDSVAVCERLIQKIDSRELEPPKSLLLLGFNEVTPLVSKLLKSCELTGAKVEFQTLTIASQVRRYQLSSTEEEIRAACHWAKEKLQAQPQARIGVVIPSLASLRSKVVRYFTHTFEPGYIYPDSSTHAPGFNISAGVPLAQTPVVDAAVNLLRFNQFKISAATVVDLLLSPFMGIEEQAFDQVVYFCETLSHNSLSLSQAQLRAALGGVKADWARDLGDRLRDFYHLNRNTQAKDKSYLTWAQLFSAQLSAVGWPGSRTLDTLEFQQAGQWHSLLQEFAQLDEVLPHCDFTEALDQLSRMLYVPFLPQTATSPIQILGLLEASGMQFDFLWIMGLSDNMWPEPCQPNALLPVLLQKEAAMPRASVEKEYTLAKTITQQFACSAGEVIFSYPVWEGDQALRPSALITVYPEVAGDELARAAAVSEGPLIDSAATGPRAPLEFVHDTHGLALNSHQKTVSGGSAILKHQAACAFRAYAKFRLHARTAEPSSKGVSALHRGNLIHDALEHCWATLANHDSLIHTDDETLDHLIQEALAHSWLHIKTDDIGTVAKSLELARAKTLISRWLNLEKARPAFTVVSQEQTLVGKVGPLEVKVRLDRMDRLADGSLAILDYKTGKTDIKSWFSDRPDEPQIPLYSVLNNCVSAAAFVELSVAEVAAKGITDNAELWPALSLPENIKFLDSPLNHWAPIVANWARVLTDLAVEFERGFAAVNPKNNEASCRYCDLKSLCRIGMHSVDEKFEGSHDQ